MGMASLGRLIAFSSYIWMITDPIVDLSNFYNDVLVALAAADRVFDYLDTPVTTVDRPGCLRASAREGPGGVPGRALRLRPGGPGASAGISFSVEPGTTVALVGRTGAGQEHHHQPPLPVLRDPGRARS